MATIAASPTHNALGKAARRLLPLLFVLYVINFVDRANISVAALAMNADLRLSATAYGTAAGVFFLGYVLFQVPPTRRWRASVPVERSRRSSWLGVCARRPRPWSPARTPCIWRASPSASPRAASSRRHRVSDGVVSVRAAKPAP